MVRRFPSLCALKCCLFSVPQPSRGCQGAGRGSLVLPRVSQLCCCSLQVGVLVGQRLVAHGLQGVAARHGEQPK